MSARSIGLRAQVALADLAMILHGGTRDGLDRWATKYSWSDNARDAGVLVALNELVARTGRSDRGPDGGTAGFGAEASLAARLVAAHRAEDAAILDALVQIWVESPPPIRAETLHDLIRDLPR